MTAHRTRRRAFFPRRRLSRPVWIGLLLLILVIYRLWPADHDGAGFSFESSGPYRVERVVDGDTLVLAGGTRVRLIGVNTPETNHPDRPVEPLGPEAAEFLRREVEERPVTLKFDRERRDRYRRVLAYVYVGERLLNEELIRAGYSRAVTRYPYSSAMKRRFQQAEAEAREERRGIWARD